MKDIIKILVAFCYCIATEYFLIAGDEVPEYRIVGALMIAPLLIMVFVYAYKLHNHKEF